MHYLSKFFSSSRPIYFVLSGLFALGFYFLYVGPHLTFHEDAGGYLKLVYKMRDLGWDFLQQDSGFWPPLYPFLLNLYGLLLGGGVLENALPLNLSLTFLLGGAIFCLCQFLLESPRNSLVVSVVILSNGFLYRFGMSNLAAESLYFVVLLYFLGHSMRTHFGPTRSFLFGSLIFIRYIHLIFFPAVIFWSRTWRERAVNTVLFFLPFLLNQVRLIAFENSAREESIEKGLKMIFSEQLGFVGNVLGTRLLGQWGTILALCALFIFLVWRSLKSSKVADRRLFSAAFAITCSFMAIIFATHFLFDSRVIFRERMLLHLYILLAPLILCRSLSLKTALKKIILLLFLFVNVVTFMKTIHYQRVIEFDEVKRNLSSVIPYLDHELPIYSNEVYLLRDVYGIHSGELFFSSLTSRPKELPTHFKFYEMRVMVEKYVQPLDQLMAQLPKCDPRKFYDIKLMTEAIHYSIYEFKFRPDRASECSGEKNREEG